VRSLVSRKYQRTREPLAELVVGMWSLACMRLRVSPKLRRPRKQLATPVARIVSGVRVRSGMCRKLRRLIARLSSLARVRSRVSARVRERESEGWGSRVGGRGDRVTQRRAS
jgi:hypothetical protein